MHQPASSDRMAPPEPRLPRRRGPHLGMLGSGAGLACGAPAQNQRPVLHAAGPRPACPANVSPPSTGRRARFWRGAFWLKQDGAAKGRTGKKGTRGGGWREGVLPWVRAATGIAPAGRPQGGGGRPGDGREARGGAGRPFSPTPRQSPAASPPPPSSPPAAPGPSFAPSPPPPPHCHL